MEHFVGQKLDDCLHELIFSCYGKSLIIESTSSKKVIGSGEIRILRLTENEKQIICLLGLY